MTTINDAARAVARVARLLEPAGPRYADAALGLTPTGDYTKSRKDLLIDLEWLIGCALSPFEPEQAEAIRAAAVDALAALPEEIDEHFYTALKTALTDEPEGDSHV